MKKIHLLLFSIFFACSLYSQCEFENNEIDEFTGERKLNTGNVFAIKKDVHIYLDFVAIDDFIGLKSIVNLSPFDCISYDSEMYFLFKDKTVEKFINKNGLNCIEPFMFISPIDKKQVHKFSNVELEKIRCVFSNGYKDYEVEYPLDILHSAKCFYDQVK